MRLILPLILALAPGCIQADGDRIAAPAGPAPDEDAGAEDTFDDELTELHRAITRAQFEAARHGTTAHVAFGCPQCTDPMRGIVPDDALIDGPADVWN